MPKLRNLLFIVCAIQSSLCADLQDDARRILNNANLNKGDASIVVYDTATGEFLVDIQSNKQMIPASNQKLLTTGAALHVLGAQFSFNTRLVQNGNTLTVIGDGDPTFGDLELHPAYNWSTEQQFLHKEMSEWVNAVQAAGITTIDTLYVDDRVFDQNFIHPSWPANQINNWYCAQIAGINYHLNVLHFYPSPVAGTKATLGKIAPQMDWLTIGNKTTSKMSKKDKSSFWVARTPNSNSLTARGNVNATHKSPVKVAFHDPPLVFGKSLASHLRRAGIRVKQVARTPQNTPQQGTVIFSKKTLLDVALLRANRDSHNLYAEAILKRTAVGAGHQGAFEEGATVVERSVAQRLGIDKDELTVADGSGMSRNNKVTTKVLATWLASFDPKDPAGRKLLESLATPGSGTLTSRFKNTPLRGATVHAKSGYLSGVSSLSGYIVFPNRSPLTFSIIVNDVKGTVKGAKQMQEALVLAAIHASVD